MAGKRSRNVWPQGISRGNTPPGDLGDVCAVFTRDEIAGWFREWEATLVETMTKVVERAKRTREAEFPIPPEDDARDRPPQPLVTMSQREADESVDETTR